MLDDIEKYIYTNKFNHIYLYSEINGGVVANISETISKLNQTESNKGVYIKPKAIVLHINSPGGELGAGIALMNVITNSRVPIITLVEGMAASAATLITLVSKYRIISPEAVMLIHQFSGGDFGKYEELKFSSKINDKIMEMMYKFYNTYTKLSETKIKELLKRDIFLTADKCLKYGLIDKILTPTEPTVINNYFKQYPDYNLPVNILKVKTNFNNLYFYGSDKSSENTEHNYLVRKTMALQYILSFNNNNSKNSNIKQNLNTELLKSSGTPKPILLQINEADNLFSLYEVLPIINTLLLSRIPVHSFINSPTTEKTMLYTILCYKRYIYKYAFITVDFVRLLDYSSKHDNTITNIEVVRNIIIKLLKKHTKLPENIINNLFKERFYFNPKDCIKYGICDEIIK